MAEQLVETPTAELDQLALVTEVLAKRQEEAADARTQLSTLRHQIQQERIHWEEQRRQEEQAIRNQRLALEQEIAEKRGEIDAVVRAQTDVLMQKDTERQAAVKERLIAQEERRQLGDLNRERVEVERFRTEVTRRHQESEARSIEAQAMLNTASQRHEQATQQLAEVERRTADLNVLQVYLQEQEQDLVLRAKHLNAVQETIGQLVEKLPVPETPTLAPLPPAPDQPPATQIETGVVESPPSVTVPMTPPVIPELMGTPEIAPVVTDVASLPALPPGVEDVLPAVPYVHPSQRRVLDGAKPLNDQ